VLSIWLLLAAAVVDMVEQAAAVREDCFPQQFQFPHQRPTP
jgi:hypothetical protein